MVILVPTNFLFKGASKLKNFLKIKHGETEGEAGGALAVALLALIVLAVISMPVVTWALM